MKDIPLCRSYFGGIRRKDQICVDKTRLIYELAKSNGRYFLSRPRRFGKSLLIFTLESLFSHGLKYFNGLWIEKHWHDRTYKVLHLDFSLVSFDQVHLHSFDNLPYQDMSDKDLYAMLKAEITPGGRNCFFLDEIQSVSNWERAVNSLMNEYGADIYVTGSNSRMLSSELSTFLTGRYVSFEIQTLSFEEYLRFRKAASDLPPQHIAFHDYLRFGGFPIVWKNPQPDSETREMLIEGIFSSAVYRDVVERYKLRNASMLKRVIGYLADNVGNTFSGRSISDFMKSEKRRLDVETVYSYLDKLKKFFIIGKCPRYDIHGKQLLKTQEKIYFADSALRFVRNAYSEDALASTIENVVYLELRRRGYRVYTGKVGAGEIDFIAEKQGKGYTSRSRKKSAQRKPQPGRLSGCWRSLTITLSTCCLTANGPMATLRGSGSWALRIFC